MSDPHRLKLVRPALKAMASLGYSPEDCLVGMTFTEDQLTNSPEDISFSEDNEFRFHRNLMNISGDPLLGIKLARFYSLEAHGLLGYAFLSAATLREGIEIICHYASLTFSHFHFSFIKEHDVSSVQLQREAYIPEDLIDFYADRDLAICMQSASQALERELVVTGMDIPHSDKGLADQYQQQFQTTIRFNREHAVLRFANQELDSPMPRKDREASELCQQQCQVLLDRLQRRSGFIDKVRQILISEPGNFPNIEQVAAQLNITPRTLRRRLKDENSSFSDILGECRFNLAKEYLANSHLPMETIASLLGYSAASNFTNAFKRWHGASPKQFREQAK